jgi:hypothetical protein
MPELRQAGHVVDLDYPPFFIDRLDDAVPPRPPAPQIRRPIRERLRRPRRAGRQRPRAQRHRCAGDNMVSGWLNDGAGSGIPFRLTLQQAAFVSAPPPTFTCVRTRLRPR